MKAAEYSRVLSSKNGWRSKQAQSLIQFKVLCYAFQGLAVNKIVIFFMKANAPWSSCLLCKWLLIAFLCECWRWFNWFWFLVLWAEHLSSPGWSTAAISISCGSNWYLAVWPDLLCAWDSNCSMALRVLWKAGVMSTNPHKDGLSAQGREVRGVKPQT